MKRTVSLSANSTGALLGLAAYATLSVHDLMIKQLGATYSPFQIVFFRALPSFSLITIVMFGAGAMHIRQLT